MRVTDEADDQEVRRIEQQLTNFAHVEGFTLGAIFYEYETGSLAAFSELIEELRRSETHHVVVSSLEQLAHCRALQVAMVLNVELRADAAVHELSGV
ncbi:recombinase family protein [Kitasatospora sp. NPDC088391]|uniref:recombinase family protein n=1 Tax=Kitasatospora sp. NPDC088391 TaxID=3364074 RepID=UPI003823B795